MLCTSDVCELKLMANERFVQILSESKQLSASVHAAAVSRNNRRVRKVVQAAEEAGKASILTLRPGEVLFRQGDRSSAFYLVESGRIQMSITPQVLSLIHNTEPTRRFIITRIPSYA